MKTRKGALGIIARKRGISTEIFRAVLALVGAPPTLKEVPERHVWHPDGRGVDGQAPWSHRDRNDYRDCTQLQYLNAWSVLIAIGKPMGVHLDNGGWMCLENPSAADLKSFAGKFSHLSPHSHSHNGKVTD